MDLNSIAAPYIDVVNPRQSVSVQISTGPGTAARDGSQEPTFATPGTITASIAGTVLTVSAVASGTLQSSQTLAGAGVASGTQIVEQLSGTPGKAGTYRLDREQAAAVASEAMTTALILLAQVQPITWGDLQLLDGLLLNGTKRKVYLYGSVDSVVRVNRKGGDLITIATGGQDDGVWLVAQILEQYPDWVSAAITLQNEG